ncbi:MAG: ABC transporter ATP-binding protein [Patescibacteria group bacterium]
MTEPALRALNLAFGYEKGRPIVRGLSLEAHPGSALALLGANGSGKSTLLKLLAGTLRPWSGRVELCGRDLAALGRRAAARLMAVVSQGEQAASDFTVRELVALGRHPWQARFAGESHRDRAVVDEVLAALHLTPLAGRRAATLSGGERQRVRAAMALAQEPSVLLLDEPTTYLDIRHQIELLDLVTEERRRLGRTVVMVLHDLNLAAAYADRLVLLASGRVLASGSPAGVLTPENIASAYGVEAAVIHAAGGRPHVILRAGRPRVPIRGPRVHLIGGGGSAANLLVDLAGRGYRQSLGVVNRGDLDAAVAAEWGIETVLAPPASPVGEEEIARCRGVMADAAAVVVANAAFGPGNAANLSLALEARRAGKPVLLVAEDPIVSRDFTGGKAGELYAALLTAGAEEIAHEQMVASRLLELPAQGGTA